VSAGGSWPSGAAARDRVLRRELAHCEASGGARIAEASGCVPDPDRFLVLGQ
jgi:hypothetical protein